MRLATAGPAPRGDSTAALHGQRRSTHRRQDLCDSYDPRAAPTDRSDAAHRLHCLCATPLAQQRRLPTAQRDGALPGRCRSCRPTTGGTRTSRRRRRSRVGAVHRVHQQRRPRRLHPDFGGYESPGSVDIYGFPYVVVAGDQPKRAVSFYYGDESDGVNHATGQSFPFYPIPDEAITQPYWIEGGASGQQRIPAAIATC